MPTEQLGALLSLSSYRKQRAEPVHAGGRVLQVFLHADMRNGHEGLAIMAKEQGIDVSKLEPGQYVVFVNGANDKLKLSDVGHPVRSLETPSFGYLPRVIVRNPGLLPYLIQLYWRSQTYPETPSKKVSCKVKSFTKVGSRLSLRPYDT